MLAARDQILLLERAVPGKSLKSYFPKKEDEAIHITCASLKRSHQAPIPDTSLFPHIQDWLMLLDSPLNIPATYLQKARWIRDELIATSITAVLLHGDLHHDNILQNGHDWLVIDSTGVIGESAYDVAAFIRNPIPTLLTHAKSPNIIQHRIALFADYLQIPKERILYWCYVQAVLAWAWALEDNSDASYFERLTDCFDKLYQEV